MNYMVLPLFSVSCGRLSIPFQSGANFDHLRAQLAPSECSKSVIKHSSSRESLRHTWTLSTQSVNLFRIFANWYCKKLFKWPFEWNGFKEY